MVFIIADSKSCLFLNRCKVVWSLTCCYELVNDDLCVIAKISKLRLPYCEHLPSALE